MAYNKLVNKAIGNNSSVTKLLRFANQGDPAAQYNLGVRYVNGTTVAKDTSIAATWYTLAAEQGHEMAQINLALLLETGDGVRQDSTAAAMWYTKCIKQEGKSSVRACFNLAMLLRRGAALPTTNTMDMLRKSHGLLMCAVEANDGRAMMQASSNFMNGRGVGKDETMGLKLLVGAAKVGRTEAHSALAALGFDAEGRNLR